MDRDARKMWKKLGGVGSLGFSMPLSIALGVLLGTWLDGLFSTNPVLTLVFLLLGIAAAFLTLYREVTRDQD